MQLTPQQLERFDRDGYLFFPGLFSAEEMRVLRDAVPAIYAEQRPEIVREKDGRTPRTSFAAHTYSEPFAKLARHPRMVDPVQQFFGEPVSPPRDAPPPDDRALDWHTHASNPLKLSHALLRFLFCWPSLCLGGLGIVWAVLDKDKQFLHDRIAGTRIVFR